jgi:hypothetical protein
MISNREADIFTAAVAMMAALIKDVGPEEAVAHAENIMEVMMRDRTIGADAITMEQYTDEVFAVRDELTDWLEHHGLVAVLQ